MKLRELLKKINDAIRPMHVEGQYSAVDRLYDEKNAAAMPLGETAKNFSQQDEGPK